MLDRLLPRPIGALPAVTRLSQGINSSQRLGSCHMTAIPSVDTVSTAAIASPSVDRSDSDPATQFARKLAHVLHIDGIRLADVQ
jgi:hypothetical protein